MERTATLSLNGARVTLTLERRPVQSRESGLTVDLELIPADAFELSFSATIRGGNGGYHGGQCRDELRELAGGNAQVARFCDLWEAHHLNGMRSGTRAQRAALVDMPLVAPGADIYATQKAFLKERGLEPDATTNPALAYAYGSRWLFESAPPEAATEAAELLAALGGQEIRGAGPETVEEVAERLGLAVASEFVPYDPARHGPRPALHWRVTVTRQGRPVLETDYMAGIGHAPAMEAPARSINLEYGPSAREGRSREALAAWECRRGVAGRFVSYSADPVPSTTRKPILPDAGDVLACLAQDADAMRHGGFEDWCAELGYEPDSRKADAIWRACIDTGLKLQAAIGAAELDRLQEAAHAR